MAGPSTRKGFIAALIAGTLIVPGVSIALTNSLSDAPATPDEPITTMALVEPTTTAAPATTTSVADEFSSDDLSAEDLALACGEEGLALVASEASGEISDLESAALGALREICEEEGSPLPAAAVPEITEIVVVQAAPPAATTTTEAADGEYRGDGEYDDDDEHDGDEHDEEDEDDEHDEHDEDDEHDEHDEHDEDHGDDD